MMRKIVSLLMALALVLALTACDKIPGQSGGSSKDSDSGSSSSSDSGSSDSGSSSSSDSGSSDSGSKSGDGGVYAEDGYGEGRLGDLMHTYFFDFSVNSAYLTSDYNGYTPMDGYTLLVAEITVKNTSRESLTMWDYDFQGQWSSSQEDEDYAWPITTETDPVADEQLPAEYTIPIAGEKTGTLVFNVPEGESDFSISYLELFEDGTEEGEEGDSFFVFFTADAK
ncbi:MAG: DUF4352 domain-containing protein [Oscillibacter sp.]|nr:DUF4352 domain-containing protein [Oscillibacter sp.]